IEVLEVCVTARVRFSAVPFGESEKGPRLFAELCDDVRGLAAEMGCRVTGPFFDVENRGPHEKHVIGEAVRNAFSAGEAAASVMDAELIGVDSVDVLDVDWRGNNDPERREPDFRSVECEARVKVTYAFEAL
ncbi:MAG TPA: hypothetical protein HPP83_00255, partial [Candidatus Hydrogenedentes bacterium]|nr:hypothetical protein [Candidatus Hydrogenedentota bacterium]